MPLTIETLSEKCATCINNGGFDENGKVLCVTKYENKPPIIKHLSIFEGNACSKQPTLITMARREELTEKYEQEFSNFKQTATGWWNDLQKANQQIEKLKQPMNNLISQNDTLNSRCSKLSNTLLTKNEKIGELEVLVQGLKDQLANATESVYLKENDALRLELNKVNSLMAEATEEIKKIQALADKRLITINDIIARVGSVFRDCRQYAPTSYANINPYELKTYIENVQKSMQNFEGYLQTIQATA